ncbi:MAG TPA: D-TA family PLP-dependent enzyme [Dongiaceae bacterium]
MKKAQTISSLETPAPIVDLAIAERNLKRAQDFFDRSGTRLRPHIKTHKNVGWARRQVELGAVGITCQKLGEAEVMADGGIADILISFPIIGEDKLARLTAIAKRVAVSCVVDSAVGVSGIARAAVDHGADLGVMIECDVGGGRCGVQDPETAVGIARQIARSNRLRFEGLMTYPPLGQILEVRNRLQAVKAAIEHAGIAVPQISIGGTPEMYRAGEYGVETEHRPGTYIYSDRYMAARGVGTLDDCALKIIATVVSRPTGDRAVIDAGSKSLSSDSMGFPDHGVILEYPGARLGKLSEEHGIIDLSLSPEKPAIGERITIIPNHACAVSNLFDRVYGIDRDQVERMITVDARGRVA